MFWIEFGLLLATPSLNGRFKAAVLEIYSNDCSTTCRAGRWKKGEQIGEPERRVHFPDLREMGDFE